MIDLIARVADSHAHVLIRGESGTGKEWWPADSRNSPRKDKAFVAINCAALRRLFWNRSCSESSAASQPGSRPDRESSRSEAAERFPGQIGDIALPRHAKLLRVLQEREIEKLGGRKRIPVDVRILAATHRDLEKMVERGEVRQDLYYRLRVVEIALPPLRERREDIPKLVRYFLDKYGKREGLDNVRISQDALQKIMRYPFPEMFVSWRI